MTLAPGRVASLELPRLTSAALSGLVREQGMSGNLLRFGCLDVLFVNLYAKAGVGFFGNARLFHAVDCLVQYFGFPIRDWRGFQHRINEHRKSLMA